MVVWLELAVPFHSAPGVFHAKLEFHVNGTGMVQDFGKLGWFVARTKDVIS